jgi:hypothetical protein
MALFEHYAQEAAAIEQEMVRKGVLLGIDWDNPSQMNALAQESIAFHRAGTPLSLQGMDIRSRAQCELFALAQLMLTIMRESAGEGRLAHGGQVWKKFGAALWDAQEGTAGASGTTPHTPQA